MPNGDQHPPSNPEALRPHCRSAMTEELKTDIAVQARHGTKAEQQLAGLRIAAESTGTECIISGTDIHSVKAKKKCEKLGELTATQHLIRELEEEGFGGDKSKWQSEKKLDADGKVTHLFFCHRESLELLRNNHEAILMDCTYKTNRYKIPLLLIQGVTLMHTSFTIGYCFMESETQEDFNWVLRRFKSQLEARDIPDPKVWVTDKEQASINALGVILPNTANIICLWHCGKAVEIRINKTYPPAEWVPNANGIAEEPESEYKRCKKAWGDVGTVQRAISVRVRPRSISHG